MDLGPLGRVRPLICYEAIFPAYPGAPERPDWVLQVTNDAWFGRAAGPQQHLAQARLRAIEQGLPLARAANTGISAVIDPMGRVVASLGLGRAGVVDAALPPALPATPFARAGELPLALVLLAGLGGMAARRVLAPRRTGAIDAVRGHG
jgi:apolipoprotein N-acyltransferase